MSAALAAAQPPPVALAGANGGPSLAEMAQRDLDAALQLLADRAQYITGASGAAIALRRDGRNDMLCRASAGSNAPELGALLSTEFGLSGESVRTRQLLRCDDAERDARVNREVCRQLGIASVVVMPVVNDDQVLGVFELFSGRAHAFGERDLSAVQRLSEMVETAVRLAHATENLPDQLKAQEKAAESEVQEGQFLSDLVIEEPEAPSAVELPQVEPHKEIFPKAAQQEPAESPKSEAAALPLAPNQAAAETGSPEAAPAPPTQAAAISSVSESPAPEKKTLFWSAALDSSADAAKPSDADQAHVPPVLRSLHKCVACGFPVSAGRTLCVECEEKKWRGQLRSSQAVRVTSAKAAASVRVPPAPEPARPPAQAFAAAAPSMAKTAAPASAPSSAQLSNPVQPAAVVAPPAAEAKKEIAQPTPSVESAKPAAPAASTPLPVPAAKPEPQLVLSAGLSPSQSWLSRNKYVLAVLLVIAGTAAAIYFLR